MTLVIVINCQTKVEVDCSGLHMNNDEYRSTMQMLNNKQYELCSHIMYQLEKNCEQMFIFIDGGAGVGKALLGHSLCETITRFHRKKQGLLIMMNTS